MNNREHFTPYTQICKLTYKHREERPTHYKPLPQVLLFSDNKTWKKKSTDSCFHITMGSFDGADICKLVGLYIQSRYKRYFQNQTLDYNETMD